MDYIRKLFAGETLLQKSIREQTANNISIHPEEGKLLQLLIRLGHVKKIVEIGTFAGYSTLWMANALPPDGHLWTIEKDTERAARARKNLQDQENITLLEGDALSILPDLEKHGPFDMVFIDADKIHYTDYLDWTEIHVRKDGVIVGDNTFLFDAVWKEGDINRVRDTARQSMRAFNLRLADPKKYTSILLPTEEGLTIAVKNF